MGQVTGLEQYLVFGWIEKAKNLGYATGLDQYLVLLKFVRQDSRLDQIYAISLSSRNTLVCLVFLDLLA